MNVYLSLIIPCYNEGEHLESSFPQVLKTLQILKRAFEIIVIDDCSRDDTVNIVYKLIGKYKNTAIRFVRHRKNIGRGGTVMEGIKLAKGKIVGFIDIDLEVSPQYIPAFVKTIDGNKADIVVGKRYDYLSIMSLHRFVSSKLYIFLIKFMLKLPVHDTEAGYKFFNRKKILPILKSTQNVKWFWDTEILARGYMNGLKLEEIDVLFKKRYDKTSTVSLLRDSIRQIQALILFKVNVFKNNAKH